MSLMLLGVGLVVLVVAKFSSGFKSQLIQLVVASDENLKIGPRSPWSLFESNNVR